MSKNTTLNTQTWLDDLREAHREACSAFSIHQISGNEGIQKNELWKMTPHLCLKKHGIDLSKENIQQAESAVESTLAENRESQEFDILDHPLPAFALCYLASSFAFDLVNPDDIDSIMSAVLEDIEINKASWLPDSLNI